MILGSDKIIELLRQDNKVTSNINFNALQQRKTPHLTSLRNKSVKSYFGNSQHANEKQVLTDYKKKWKSYEYCRN